ncbi:MAG TPA: hypothetical protein PKA10_04810 [Selenomonadales bacterium]|nr:hypothetical protein [Selenomonadales bacterium]
MGNLTSDLLIAKAIQKQVQMIGRTQSGIRNSANILATEIKLDRSRGGDVAKKEEQLQAMKSQETKLGKTLGDTLGAAKKALDKAAKEKDDALEATGAKVNSNDPAVLRQQKLRILSKISRLTCADATANSDKIQELQHQLQQIETRLQQAPAGQGGSVAGPDDEAPSGSERVSLDVGPAYVVEIGSGDSPAGA